MILVYTSHTGGHQSVVEILEVDLILSGTRAVC